MFWSNADGFFRLIDRSQKHWAETIGVNLEETLRKSNAFLLQAMMTESGLRLLLESLPSHVTFHAHTNDTQ